MADIVLNQAEANSLIDMEKRFVNDVVFQFPPPGDALRIALESIDKREAFVLDVTRGRIKLSKATFNMRGRQVIVLLRLDIEGPPHRNPDGEEIPCPHLHVYRENFGVKWAEPAPPELASSSGDTSAILDPFLSRCNVITIPKIQRGLF